MLYISLPVLLTVESLILYFPSASSGSDQLLRILIGDFNACNPDKLCCDSFSFFYLRFPVFKDIYIQILEYNSIDILCAAYFFLLRDCLIFLFNGRGTALLIADDIIPFISFADLQYFFTDI